MHGVDPTTEQMIRSVLAYAENRLRLDPVPLDGCRREPAEFDALLNGIAALPGAGEFLLTGKGWRSIYHVRLAEHRAPREPAGLIAG